MMSLEARTLLDLNSLIEARDKSRIFGNCDSDIRPYSKSEIIFLVMKSISFSNEIQNLYERNDSFYARTKLGLLQGIQRS